MFVLDEIQANSMVSFAVFIFSLGHCRFFNSNKDSVASILKPD